MKFTIPKAFFLLLMTFILMGFASDFASADIRMEREEVLGPPPSGWVHRPLIEFFTGLSCPSCMGSDVKADSPEKAIHDAYLDAKDDPEVPHTTIVFHELNGGGEDDLNNPEATARMRYYQPGLSGTPDVEIDGGYIELGGFSTSTRSIDETNVNWALQEAKQRHNNAPLRPLERATWSFPYIRLEVDQVFLDGQFSVVGKVIYDGNAKMVGAPQLQGSLYVFMVEDGVDAYSKVYKHNVTNDAVFRGYAVEDESFSLRNGNTWEFSANWPIPDYSGENEVPIKPQNVYAVAAVYDTQDTTSAASATDGNMKAGSPRCLQSATSDSTAYDRENTPPSITNLDIVDGEATVTFHDEGGIANAVLFYNFEAENSTNWKSIPLELTGEEVCDDEGVCYAYFDPIGSAKIETGGGQIFAQVLANDDQMAQAKSSVYVIGEATSDTKSKDSTLFPGFGGIALWLFIGILIILMGIVMYLLSRKKQGNFFKFFGSKGTMAIFILIGLIFTFIGGAGMFTKEISTVPEFTVTDTQGNVHTPQMYEGKVLVIDIMFTTCSVCTKEMPELVETYNEIKEQYGEDVQFLSVSVDPNDDNSAMNQFQDKYGAGWPIGKNKDFSELFDAFEVPKKIIVAPNGEIAYQHTGYTDKGDLKEAVKDAHEGTYQVSSISQTGGSIVGIGFIAAVFGILTFFSPCSFPMLPGYFSYYLSTSVGKDERKKVSPFKGGTFAAMGIVAFFVIIGIFVAIAGAAIQAYLYILMPIVGLILLVLGVLTLVGKDMFLEKLIDLIKYPFIRLSYKLRGERQAESSGVGGLFAYGFGYGAAASSCMAPAFVGVIFLGLATPLGWLGAVIVFVAYTIAIGAMMIIFSVMAGKGAKILEKFVSSTDVVKRISGLLLLFAGIFVIWYSFWGYKVIGGFFSF